MLKLIYYSLNKYDLIKHIQLNNCNVLHVTILSIISPSQKMVCLRHCSMHPIVILEHFGASLTFSRLYSTWYSLPFFWTSYNKNPMARDYTLQHSFFLSFFKCAFLWFVFWYFRDKILFDLTTDHARGACLTLCTSRHTDLHWKDLLHFFHFYLNN